VRNRDTATETGAAHFLAFDNARQNLLAIEVVHLSEKVGETAENHMLAVCAGSHDGVRQQGKKTAHLRFWFWPKRNVWGLNVHNPRKTGGYAFFSEKKKGLLRKEVQTPDRRLGLRQCGSTQPIEPSPRR